METEVMVAGSIDGSFRPERIQRHYIVILSAISVFGIFGLPCLIRVSLQDLKIVFGQSFDNYYLIQSKMKPVELKTSPEQTQTTTRVIFDILKEHGPLTVGDTWERVKEVGLRGLTSKRHMKIVMRWMRGRQKIRLICNHVGPHKQFL
ncbi:hypothetical protein V6Z11_D10G000500 [Gossypium hirsutum]|uniref:Uncharacterized protein LOC107943770 isoform X1 n=1 Tax=Gossypium hirsutum TaxID=3635 RepID=A0A1U8N5G7_GOSHI|nr:uncharacterized protein LOC107943770 isoform X1 [Gossypium hirsutum]XP_016733058.1 uncharacterized protein LOC107943770 isoform X1 [Gossypium hirsutum]XP_016733059.1 uncharacterized protein LOC107943770 isoform X1 [Gossypium hirsutum]XP_016733060.1 uncharacterized protein LOC107943770 isoform X1 [Gossypium hirsutum]XP_016733061.1 uncharacterized protein LOC107943770 isoform X1 [Gossypium hirsutum]XP_016733062.1 uncharacterized protein LOC107943770 isoform X1 [Gossypium hirsutum]XP_01673306